jgi:hypothetical protein
LWCCRVLRAAQAPATPDLRRSGELWLHSGTEPPPAARSVVPVEPSLLERRKRACGLSMP